MQVSKPARGEVGIVPVVATWEDGRVWVRGKQWEEVEVQ